MNESETSAVDRQPERKDASPCLTEALKLLMLEDVLTDAELILRVLDDDGLAVAAQRVETEQSFVAAIERFMPDIVLADCKLAKYDGLSAIKLVRSRYPDLPVIVVTGAMGDETAVELIKAGAVDYVLKDRLARLPAAVRRALCDVAQAAERRRLEVATRNADKSLHAIAASSQDAVVMMNDDMVINFWNRSAEKCFGYSAAEAIGRDIYSFLATSDDVALIRRDVDEFNKADQEQVANRSHRLRVRKGDGTTSPLDLSITFIRLEQKWNVVGVVRPHTPRL